MRHCEYQPGRIWWNQRSLKQDSSGQSSRCSGLLRTRPASASSICWAMVRSAWAIWSRFSGFRNPRHRGTWRTFASRGWSSTSDAASGASTSSHGPIPASTRRSWRPCRPPDRGRPGPTTPRFALCGGLGGAVRSTPVHGELEPMAVHLPEAGQPAQSANAQPTFARRLVAEGLGTALLLATVVGSGIMGERLAGGNVAIALLANTLATGAGLVALILTLGPISGAHFNPAVTLADAALGGLRWRDVPGYILAQVAGAYGGVAVAHGMFGEAVFTVSRHARAGGAQFLSEFVATFGLLAVIWGVARRRSTAVPFAVAAYITAAYWFTASTSFANPAVTLGRSASDTFAGIRPADVPGFVAAQLLGAAAATLLFRWLVPTLPERAPDLGVPRQEQTEEAS